ncbi:hypothetical protein B0T10DRAFT_220778 [Thelonectria olida]|uniref:Uncharacterized protein n=1 Tax=Thelonectria olida TaxID=1576542 RepID=A0A9P9ATT9_9HYPO|nr:hypothetical protein B0T10DRAFT_220778 [Thelonectria olida]
MLLLSSRLTTTAPHGSPIIVPALRHSPFFFVIFLLRQVKFFQLLRFVRLRPSYVQPGCKCICRTLSRFSIDMGPSDGQRPAPTASLLSLSCCCCTKDVLSLPSRLFAFPQHHRPSGGRGVDFRLPSAAGERAMHHRNPFQGRLCRCGCGRRKQKAGGEGVRVEVFHHVMSRDSFFFFSLSVIHTAQQTRSLVQATTPPWPSSGLITIPFPPHSPITTVFPSDASSAYARQMGDDPATLTPFWAPSPLDTAHTSIPFHSNFFFLRSECYHLGMLLRVVYATTRE